MCLRAVLFVLFVALSSLFWSPSMHSSLAVSLLLGLSLGFLLLPSAVLGYQRFNSQLSSLLSRRKWSSSVAVSSSLSLQSHPRHWQHHQSISPRSTALSAAAITPINMNSDTQATRANIDQCKEALTHFIDDGDAKFLPTSGGVNNIVQYVETSDGHKYVMRIYNNGYNTARVSFEHAILNQLKDFKLSFHVPKFIPALKTGETFVRLSDSAEACLCELIPGKLPKSAFVEDIGRAAGELQVALAKLTVPPPSPTPPYHELYRAHHAVTKEKFDAVIASADFDPVREVTNKMLGEIELIEKKNIAFLKLDLPNQLIHGDLHYDNILVHEDQVSGLLDFEFSAFDWRAMELAVCLSKYAGAANAMENVEGFIRGFGVHGRLRPAEVDAMPDLIILRILSNVVYFVGRSIANEDSIEALTMRIETYHQRIVWIHENAEIIRDFIRKYVPSD